MTVDSYIMMFVYRYSIMLIMSSWWRLVNSRLRVVLNFTLLCALSLCVCVCVRFQYRLVSLRNCSFAFKYSSLMRALVVCRYHTIITNHLHSVSFILCNVCRQLSKLACTLGGHWCSFMSSESVLLILKPKHPQAITLTFWALAHCTVFCKLFYK